MKRRKRCLADFEIQSLIDGELSVDDRNVFNRHAEECSMCSGRIEETRQWKLRIKMAMQRVEPASALVPEFAGKAGSLPKKHIGRLVRRLAGIAALVALAVIMTTIISDRSIEKYKPTAHDLMLWEENSLGNDANRLWHNRSVTIMITGPKGEVEIINLN
jgi:hypothetical protein